MKFVTRRNTMLTEQKWEERLLERARKIVQHGHGEMTMTAVESKGKTKIIIKAGEHWMYWVEVQKGICEKTK